MQTNVGPSSVALDGKRTKPGEEHEEEKSSHSHGGIDEPIVDAFSAWQTEPGGTAGART